MLRVIREIQPAFVIGENVPGIVNLALDTVLSDLENEEYATQAFIIPACGVDAPHKRERVCILAHAVNRGSAMRRHRELQDADCNAGRRDYYGGRTAATIPRERRENESGASGMADGLRTEVYRTDTDADSIGLSRWVSDPLFPSKRLFTDCSCREREREEEQARIRRATAEFNRGIAVWEDWIPEPGVGRVAHGVSHRVDRIKCLGNAVVPQQFYPFFEAVMKELQKEESQ